MNQQHIRSLGLWFHLLTGSVTVLLTSCHDAPPPGASHPAVETEPGDQSASETEPRDNVLTVAEKSDGWTLLFDGETDHGWMTSGEQPSKTPVQDGAINPHGCGHYMMVHKDQFDDFILSLDFKIDLGVNSGIFFRTHSLVPRPEKDVGYNGIEMAIDDTTSAGYHDTGAIYDLVMPRTNAMRSAGEWNHVVITCNREFITVELNGEVVSEMDLEEWTEANRRPDGSEHKFDVAYRDHPRKGYIGLQDHGGNCWFKNIKLKKL